jgi:cathepsin X
LCRDCVPPAPSPDDDGLYNCAAVPHKKYYVSEYYNLSGVHKMKSDLAVHGPISCGIQATPNFDVYMGGIYSEHLENVELNHEISVVGYGVTKEG